MIMMMILMLIMTMINASYLAWGVYSLQQPWGLNYT